MSAVKVVIPVAVVAFLLFYVINSPDQAADIVHHIWTLLVNAAHGIGRFFDKVSS